MFKEQWIIKCFEYKKGLNIESATAFMGEKSHKRIYIFPQYQETNK